MDNIEIYDISKRPMFLISYEFIATLFLTLKQTLERGEVRRTCGYLIDNGPKNFSERVNGTLYFMTIIKWFEDLLDFKFFHNPEINSMADFFEKYDCHILFMRILLWKQF